MFCWACIWNRYSLPSRRTGSPVQDSAGPRTAKLTPAWCSRRASDWVVLRARSSRAPAQPTQNRYSTSSGIVPVDDRDLEVEPLGPLEALGGAEPPGVAPVLDVAQHEAGLGRETGLDQHLVAAHVDDGVDVLDVDRALLDAGPARRARPEHVVGDDLGHEGLRGSFAEQLVAQVHDDELGRERLARVPGRALALAAPALGAGHEVQELLPGEVLDPAGAEDRVLVHRLDVDLGRLVEGAEPGRLAGEGDVQRCHEDVKVLGVHDEDQKRHDHDDVQVDEDRLERPVGRRRRAAAAPRPMPWEAKAHQP